MSGSSSFILKQIPPQEDDKITLLFIYRCSNEDCHKMSVVNSCYQLWITKVKCNSASGEHEYVCLISGQIHRIVLQIFLLKKKHNC